MLVFGSGAVAAQEPILSGVLSGGLAGSLDEGSGFSNPSFQVRFAIETARHRFLSFRLGRMDFSDRSLSLLGEVTLDYLTVSGEYLFTEGNYDSGFFMASVCTTSLASGSTVATATRLRSAWFSERWASSTSQSAGSSMVRRPFITLIWMRRRCLRTFR